MRNHLLHILLILLCAAYLLPAQNPYLPGSVSGGTTIPGTKTRSPLNSLERAANSLPGATILTDTFGNQRFALFVYISDTCLASAPTPTGNTANLNSFISICGSDSTYYIDWTGKSVFTGGGAAAQNWYTVDDTTTDVTRTAYILNQAYWTPVDADNFEIGFYASGIGHGVDWYMAPTRQYWRFYDLGGTEKIELNTTGIDLSTSNSASRAVDITTDTVNLIGSFDDQNFRINFLSTNSYLFVDSTFRLALGVFPSFPAQSGTGEDKGLYYDPLNEEVVSIWNGDGATGEYAHGAWGQSSISLLNKYQDVTYNYTDNGITVGSSQIQDAIVEQNSQSAYDQIAAVDLNNVNWRTRVNDNPDYGDTMSFFQAYQTTDGGRDAQYAAMGNGPMIGGGTILSVVYVGKGSPNATDLFVQSDRVAFGVQQNSPGSNGTFDWLKIDLFDYDTTRNGIQFYNGRYRWENAYPSATVGDTSFHFWAGTGTGTNPGFITLDDVCAHCSESAVNWYNSNGTTTDNTRIADVLETATWRSSDTQIDGVVPFRFELDGPTQNEPEIMTWKFENDSLVLGQSDQEITFHSNGEMLMWAGDEYLGLRADGYIVHVADSTIWQGGIETKSATKYIAAFTSAGTLKRFDAAVAGSGAFLVSNGVNWVAQTAAGAGYILNGGNTTGAAITIGTNDAFGLNLETNNVTRMAITGAASTGGAVTISNTTTNTNTVQDVVTIQTNSTGTAAANFGSRILFQGESSTTDNQDMVGLSAIWTTATHASRASALVYSDVTAAGAITERFRFTPTAMTMSGNYTIGNSSNNLTIGGSSGLITLSSSGVANGIILVASAAGGSNTGNINIGNSSVFTQTSGTRNYIQGNWSFSPTSGTAVHNQFVLDGTFNQTGGANGVTRGVYLNQTLTAVADFRGIEIAYSNSSAKGIYQTGSSTTNNFVGATGFGATTTPTDKLEVTGNFALLTAGNKIKIATGSNASMGTATLVAGTVTVNTTAVATGSTIFVSCNTPGGVQGILSAPAASITNATSFIINSSNVADTSTVNWWLIN